VFCLQELDTQNFESFDEDDAFAKKQKQNVAASRKDLDFIGYTYKNFEVVGEEVQKKKGKAKPSLASIFPGMPAMTPERENRVPGRRASRRRRITRRSSTGWRRKERRRWRRRSRACPWLNRE
jgi:hypothetical protein